MNGLVLIDKSDGCTSHDVVNRWRKLAGVKQAGHIGTLDPMATGLLGILTGPATRLAQFYGGAVKTYEAQIELGKISDSYDADGEVVKTGAALPSADEVIESLNAFRGTYEQLPPPVSAKKIKGVPAYKLKRKNIEFELKAVPVSVTAIDFMAFAGSYVSARFTVSAGTYIRSLAHDLGQRLGCGAILSGLRRYEIGSLKVTDARTLPELESMQKAGDLDRSVVPAGKLLPELPAAYVDEQTESFIRQGRQFRTSPFSVPPGAEKVRALSLRGELIAIGNLIVPNVYHPGVVLSARS